MAVKKKAVRQKKAGQKSRQKNKIETKPIRAFKTQKDFESWLEKILHRPGGVWIRFAKKASGIKSITHPEALDTALCFGWIDALRLPESDTTYLQRFLPRRPKSLWSKLNRACKAGRPLGRSVRLAGERTNAGGFSGATGSQPEGESVFCHNQPG